MITETGTVPSQGKIPTVYTIRGCDSCVKLLNKWDAEGVVYERAPRGTQSGDLRRSAPLWQIRAHRCVT
jgi:hypothetical protein